MSDRGSAGEPRGEPVDNGRIASLLKETAVYRVLAGENPFGVRAYEYAARLIDGFPEAVTDLAAEDRLGELKGVGKGPARIVREIVETGGSAELEELKRSFPPGLRDMLSLSGLGPRKVKALWEKLGVTDLQQLERACREGWVSSLEGFGVKSQRKILQAVEFRKTSRGRFLLSQAMDNARAVVAEIEDSGLCRRVDIAGSLRRGKSVLKDADILLVPAKDADPSVLGERLLGLADGYPGEDGAAGETKVSVIRGGMQIDFRIVEEASHPAALQHFTGSREHNTLLRSRAKAMGLKMNEYGVFRGDRPLPLEDEAAVYRSVGLPWIPPELREGAGEIEAAEAGSLPKVVQRSDIRGMIHVHSNYSDGIHGIRELAEECIRRGFSYLCLSDHSRSAFYAGGLNIERIAEQRAEVERVNQEVAPFRIFCGIESDILTDGGLDYPDEILEGLDFVIGSIHSRLGMRPEEATARLLRAIRNPHLTMLGHPSGRLLLSREGYTFDEGAVFEALAERGVVLEHNCHPQRLDPDWDSLKRAGSLGILISLDPDAHAIRDFDYLEYGLTMARKAWLAPGQVLNCMTVEEIDAFFREGRAPGENGRGAKGGR